MCVDTYDSYYCTCQPGYQLQYNAYTCPVATYCSFARANVVFVISSSSSICNSQTSCSQWSTELNFVSNIVNSFNIGSNGVLVGLVTYSAVVNSPFYLNNFSDKTSLINFINSIAYNPGGFGQIDFAGALREARTNQFTTGRGKRLGAQDILILLTNGESAVTSSSAVAELSLIRAAGIKVYSIGLTSSATAGVVSGLVQPPPPILNWNYFLNSAINQQLSALASPVSNQVCLAAASNCLAKVIDLVFVVPSTMSVWQAGGNNPSYFSSMMNFIGDLVQNFNINFVKVGLVIYGDFGVLAVPLTNNQPDINSLANVFRSYQFQNLSFGHNIQSALSVLRNQAFTSGQGDRADVPNVAVVITDAASSANTISTLAEAQAAMQQQGIRLFTIGATNNVNITELQLISSLPRLQFHEWWTVSSLDFSQLAPIEYNVEMELCRPDYEVHCRYTASGGYQCFCPWGFCDTRPMNGSTCVDVNECAVNNGGCSQICSNSIGSFSCSCRTGFQNAPDGRTCVDVDECSSGSNPCTSGLCINTYGNYYCLNTNALIQAQVADAPASGGLSAEFPGTVIGLSAALAVTATILIAVVIGFIVYAVRRGRDSSLTDRDPIVSSASGGQRHMGHVVASGFDSVRSKYSVASDDSSDIPATTARDG